MYPSTKVTDYPNSVQQALQNILMSEKHPISLKLDAGYKITSMTGEPEYFGLNLATQNDAREQLPCLFGLPLEEPGELACVNITEDKAADIHLLPEQDGGATVILLDVSHNMVLTRSMQQNANELSISNYRQQQLSDRLMLANWEVEKQREKAEQASRLKSEFIAGMSHEFRTPLASILGYCQVIREGFTEDLPHCVSAIRRSADHLVSLVENLLDHGRITSEKIELLIEPVRISTLITDIADMLRPIAESKGLTFSADFLEMECDVVLADPVRLRQILINLISNAIRYTQEGFVKVACRHLNSRLVVQISDSGIGIAEDDLINIFEAFHQVNNQAKSGVGLGLAISSHLAELMDGRIDVQSTVGEGSIFTLNVKAEAALKESETATHSQESDQAITALVIDDDPEIRNILEIVFNDMGLDVVTAETGTEAVDQLTNADPKPSVCFVDMNLPDCKTGDLVNQMKELTGDLRWFAMSASNTEQTRQEAQKAGCAGFFAKPFDFDVMMREIGRG